MIEEIHRQVRQFEKEAHNTLGHHESAIKSRTITIEPTIKKLSSLSLTQDDQFRQALRCIENGLYRASHVMAWSAFIDFLECKLGEDGYAKLRAIKKDCAVQTIEELREKYNDFQIITCLRQVNMLNKTEEKALHALLNKRNECAHPSSYYPDHNQSLGYYSELMGRLELLQQRKIS